MSDREYAWHEYDDEVMRRIWATLGPCESLQREQFISDLQSAAWFYRGRLEAAEGKAPPPAASIKQRKFETAARAIRKVRSLLPKGPLDFRDYEELRAAAQDLVTTRYGIFPPNCEPLRALLPLLPEQTKEDQSAIEIWPTDEAYLSALKSLDWLAAVADHAANLAEQEKGPTGNRPNEPAHDFVWALATLYERATETKPRPPTYDPIEGVWKGAFLDFAVEAFHPIDPRSREAIASLLKRALFAKS